MRMKPKLFLILTVMISLFYIGPGAGIVIAGLWGILTAVGGVIIAALFFPFRKIHARLIFKYSKKKSDDFLRFNCYIDSGGGLLFS